MTASLTILTYAVLFVLLAVPGYILGRCGYLKSEAGLSLSNILIYIAMPFLVFSVLIRTDIKSFDPVDFAVCVFFPFILEIILLLITAVLFRKKLKGGVSQVNRFCSVFSNCGFLGIPLASALFPNDPVVALYVSIYNVFSSFMLWTLGIYILSGDRSKIRFDKALLNPITAAIVLGALLSAIDISLLLPYIRTYASMLAAMTAPLSMTYLGFKLSKIKMNRIFREKAVYTVSLVKLVLSPLIGIGIILLLRFLNIPASKNCFRAMFIASAVSTAATAPPLADKYGLDGEYAAVLTLGNTLLSIITLPLMYLLF